MFHGLKRAINSITAALLPPETKLGLFPSTEGKWYVVDHAGNKTILGDGIEDYALISTVDKVKTYRITRQSGEVFEFVIADGEDGLDGQGQPANAAPPNIGAASSVGTATTKYALEDHAHGHGEQAGGTTHAVATTMANGFMSKEDKAKTDGIAEGATRVLVDNTPTDGSANAVSSNGVFDSLALKLNAAEKGAANGVTPLGADLKVPAIFLPAFVDDVLEFANLAAFPATGETGKIYVALNAGTPADPSKIYRWSGSTYIEVSPSPGSTDAVPEGASNLYFTAQRVRDTLLTGLSLVAGTAITAADSVLSAFGKLQKQITDAVAALASHISDPDPHSQYLTAAEAAALIPPNKLSARISTLFASPANSTAVTIVLSLAIPANYLTTGKSFDFDLEGTQSQSAAATNVVGAIFVNNTQLVTQAVAGGTAAQTNRSLRMKGGIMWNGANYLGNITVGISGILPLGNANVTGVPVAAATAHNIDIRVQTSTANAANIIRAMVAAIKEI